MTKESTSRPLDVQSLEKAIELYKQLDADRADAFHYLDRNYAVSEIRTYYPLGEDITYACNDNNRAQYLMDDRAKRAWRILDAYGNLMHFSADDIDFEKVDQLENVEYVHDLYAKFRFNIESYQNGVALVHWTAYPDGLYFADEDGFGAEPNNEVNVYAYIDRDGRTIIPFQPMTGEERKDLRRKAEEIVKMRSQV